MADPKSFASTYAVPSTDEETLRKRRDLASRLFQAKQAGKSMNEAVMSESGVDIGNLQKGSVDVKMGTGLTEEEVAGFAERLYAGKFGGNQKQATSEVTPKTTDENQSVANLSGNSLLDRYDALQKSPMGSVSIGATGVQGAIGGLAEGPSKTKGTPIGGPSVSDQMNRIVFNTLSREAAERRRAAKEQKAEELGYSRVYGVGNSQDMRVPYFLAQLK